MATPTASIFLLQGQRITPFISPWSTMTMTESKDLLGGRSVIRSTETCWKGQVQLDFKEERAGMMGWVLTLFAWQTAYLATYF